MENTNVFEIPPPKITYDYQLSRNSFIKGIIESDRLLAASSVTPVFFRLVVNYSDLYRSNRTLRNSNLAELPSLLIMTCELDEVMNFELTGTLPLVR